LKWLKNLIEMVSKSEMMEMEMMTMMIEMRTARGNLRCKKVLLACLQIGCQMVAPVHHRQRQRQRRRRSSPFSLRAALLPERSHV
jgi:ACT domain-containing protein